MANDWVNINNNEQILHGDVVVVVGPAVGSGFVVGSRGVVSGGGPGTKTKEAM